MIRVQHEPFDIAAEVAALSAGRTDIGAIVTFTGIVRGEAKGASGERHPIRSMTLEHYPGMTEAELARIETEATPAGRYRARRSSTASANCCRAT